MILTIDPPLPQEYKGHFRLLSGFDPLGVGGYSLTGAFLGGPSDASNKRFASPDLTPVVFGIGGPNTGPTALLLMSIPGFQDSLKVPIDNKDVTITAADCRIVAFAQTYGSGSTDPRCFTQGDIPWGSFATIDKSKTKNAYYLIGICAVSKSLCLSRPGTSKQPDGNKNTAQNAPAAPSVPTANGNVRYELTKVNLPDMLEKATPPAFIADDMIIILGEDRKFHSLSYLSNFIGELSGKGWDEILTDQAQKLEATAALLRVLATSALMQRSVDTPGAKDRKHKKK